MSTALDTRTIVGDSVAVTEPNSWEEALVAEFTEAPDLTLEAFAAVDGERVWRYSYKWRVTCTNHKPMLDYVFAANPDEAVEKAYRLLEIPADQEVTVVRVSESTNKTWSLS